MSNKVISNGYVTIYMPNHKRAYNNGCVYEHILVAEKILGRELKKEECVHHKDRNRKNNKETNLMIFATINDHTAYHNGGEPILQTDGTYKTIIKVNTCENCGKEISRKAKLCIECNNKLKKINSKIISKEELKKLIYTTPFTTIGKMYDVSDNAVRKWCKKYNLPYRKKDIINLNSVTDE